MTTKSFAPLFEEARKHLDYWVAGAEIEFTEELCRAMEEQGVNRAELARRIGSSPAYITKVLGGNANFTLTTMVKLARALELEVKIHLAPEGAYTIWKDDLGDRWSDQAEVVVPKRSSPARQEALVGDWSTFMTVDLAEAQQTTDEGFAFEEGQHGQSAAVA